MAKIPVSFIVDDSSPVNTFFFHDSSRSHEFLVPPAFLKDFARITRENGVRGKFSMLPVPCGLGRIDRKVNLVPAKNVRDYIRITKNEIEPAFSITPEILTHHLCYDAETDWCGHLCEDEYISRQTAEGVAKYVGAGLEILANVGLNPTGVTSPWVCGLDNEDNYASGIGMAFRKVLKRDHCFYFLHTRDPKMPSPLTMCKGPKTGRVVSVPNNTIDAFWDTQRPFTAGEARANVRKKLNILLSPDGKTGRLRDLFEAGLPMTFVSHWQSLYSDGRAIGLAGLETLVKRINRVFGKSVEWMSFEELAESKPWPFAGKK